MEHRQPAEWSAHESTWLAWPTDAREWGAFLKPAQRAFLELCAAIGEGERLDILVQSDAAEETIRDALPQPSRAAARFHRIPFGDIWLRDTGPIFVREGDRLAAARFRFNGWGEKYLFENDPEVGARIAAAAGVRRIDHDLIFEGGSLDVDGEGTGLTTRECLLNPNRNPGLDEPSVQRALAEALGVERLLWLDRGLVNDHTDGHVDNLARFVAPGVVACMAPAGPDDPNREVLEAIAADLAGFRDAAGRRLELVRLPSPGRVDDEHGRPAAASYLNFYVANAAVVVPVFGTPHDEQAVDVLAGLFPGRRAVAIDARAVLTGGGTFHCITREEPKAP